MQTVHLKRFELLLTSNAIMICIRIITVYARVHVCMF